MIYMGMSSMIYRFVEFRQWYGIRRPESMDLHDILHNTEKYNYYENQNLLYFQ